MKKKYLLHVLVSIPLLLLWLLLITLLFVAQKEGVLSVLSDVYGILYFLGLLLLVLVLLGGFFCLPFVMKKEWMVQIILYAMTAVLCLYIFLGVHFGNNQFKDFSKDNWMKYPAQRITMFEDLKNTYKVIGLEAEEVIDLMGEPDEMMQDGIYVYDTKHGNAVYVEFEDGKVADFYFIE